MPEPNTSVYCDTCGKTFASKFNLKRHKDLVHSFKDKKYMKHEKKGKKYQCKICKALFFPSVRLKEHYLKAHKKEQLIWNGIEMEQLLRRKPLIPKEQMPQLTNDMLSK